MNPALSHALIGFCCLMLGICVGYSITDNKKFNSQIVLNIGVALVSICALSGLLVSISQYRDVTSCQAAYNMSLVNAIKERAVATDTDRLATRTVVDAILSPTSTPQSRLQALQEWKIELDKADQGRASSPLPLTPECAREH